MINRVENVSVVWRRVQRSGCEWTASWAFLSENNGSLLPLSSHSNLLEDRVHVDFFCRYPNLKWVAETRINESQLYSCPCNAWQGHMPYWVEMDSVDSYYTYSWVCTNHVPMIRRLNIHWPWYQTTSLREGMKIIAVFISVVPLPSHSLGILLWPLDIPWPRNVVSQSAHLLAGASSTSMECFLLLTCISNYIYHKVWDGITYSQTSTVQPLKFRNEK